MYDELDQLLDKGTYEIVDWSKAIAQNKQVENYYFNFFCKELVRLGPEVPAGTEGFEGSSARGFEVVRLQIRPIVDECWSEKPKNCPVCKCGFHFGNFLPSLMGRVKHVKQDTPRCDNDKVDNN